MFDHDVHNEGCGCMPRAEGTLVTLSPEPKAEVEQIQEPLAEATFRKLRGQYFTVRHHRVQPCNHLLDQINEPTFRNCEACWFCFFNSHGTLVEVTDKALQEQGAAFLDKMRGRQYRKMFTRFMSTIAQLKRESDERAREESKNTDNQTGEVQSGVSGGESVRQETRDKDVSTTREQSQPSDPQHSN